MAEPNRLLETSSACADAFSLLSLFTQLPTKELFDGTADGTLADDVRAIAAEAALDNCLTAAALNAFDRLRAQIAAGEADYQAVRREHTRLFEHPERPAIRLYEGQFVFDRDPSHRGCKPKDRPRLFVNAAASDAAREYRAAGFHRVSERNVPEDSMYVEMEFVGALFLRRSAAIIEGDAARQRQAEDALAEFKYYHLDKWMDSFFQDCVEISSCGLYQAAGYFGMAVYRGLGNVALPGFTPRAVSNSRPAVYSRSA